MKTSMLAAACAGFSCMAAHGYTLDPHGPLAAPQGMGVSTDNRHTGSRSAPKLVNSFARPPSRGIFLADVT